MLLLGENQVGVKAPTRKDIRHPSPIGRSEESPFWVLTLYHKVMNASIQKVDI